jgi:ADP-ribosylglycohydrolase
VRLESAIRWIDAEATPEPQKVRRHLGAGIAAEASCVTAIYLATRFLEGSFTDLQSFVADMGGDVDTIGAMAGAIWGAANGACRLPLDHLPRLEQRDRIQAVAEALHRRHTQYGSLGT